MIAIPNTDNVTVAKIAAALALIAPYETGLEDRLEAFQRAYRVVCDVVEDPDAGTPPEPADARKLADAPRRKARSFQGAAPD
jgi:hypothetical protein